MGYVEEHLLKDEEIKYTASIHWAAFLPGIFWTILAIIVTAAFGRDGGFVAILLWLIAAFRFCKGLIYKSYTECVLTNTRIIYHYGFISRQTVELQLTKCEGVSVDQGLFGRMLGYGTVVVTTGGPTNSFSVIDDPISFRNAINEQIDVAHSATSNKATNTATPSVSETKPNQQQVSATDELLKLSDLLNKGLITEEEFKTMKSKIINQG